MRRARNSLPGKMSNDGIRLSGLMCWVSAIQPAMLPTLLGRMPAPRARPDVGQIGAELAIGRVPRMVWQVPQPLSRNSS